MREVIVAGALAGMVAVVTWKLVTATSWWRRVEILMVATGVLILYLDGVVW